MSLADEIYKVLQDPLSLPSEFVNYLAQYVAQNPVSVGAARAPVLIPTGTVGATAATRFVGATVSGAPASGNGAVGDVVIDQSGAVWVCTVTGSPGTWVNVGSKGNLVSSVFARTGAVVAGNADYLAVATGGLTGATSATRYVGGTTSGAPSTGTFAVGDFVVARNGHVWICTTAGSPGTWADVGSVGNLVTSVFGRAGVVTAASGDYTAAQVTNAADKSSTSTQAFSGGITSGHATEGFGYATGAGGTVTQLTSKTTAVTLNTVTGQIVMNAANLNSNARASFFLNNSAIGTTDGVAAWTVNSGAGSSLYSVAVVGTGSGVCELSVLNVGGVSEGAAVVLGFAVIKSATA